jgi:hypothetical protein
MTNRSPSRTSWRKTSSGLFTPTAVIEGQSWCDKAAAAGKGVAPRQRATWTQAIAAVLAVILSIPAIPALLLSVMSFRGQQQEEGNRLRDEASLIFLTVTQDKQVDNALTLIVTNRSLVIATDIVVSVGSYSVFEPVVNVSDVPPCTTGTATLSLPPSLSSDYPFNHSALDLFGAYHLDHSGWMNNGAYTMPTSYDPGSVDDLMCQESCIEIILHMSSAYKSMTAANGCV